jgi:hypothetical protein
MLLARIYEVFPLVCPFCGGTVQIIPFITEAHTLHHILEHIGESAEHFLKHAGLLPGMRIFRIPPGILRCNPYQITNSTKRSLGSQVMGIASSGFLFFRDEES